MAVAAPSIELVAPRERVAAKAVRMVAKAPLRLLLAGIGLLWLVPTFGLFITSILPQSSLATQGCGRSSPSRASPPGRTTTRSSTTRG